VAARPNKRAREESDNDTDSGNSDTARRPDPKVSRKQLMYTSSTPLLPKQFLQHPLCLRGMLKVAKNHLFHGLGQTACRQSLHAARDSVKEQLEKIDPNIKNEPWKQIPLSLPTLLKTFDLDTTIQRKLCCPFCCALYPVPTKDQNHVNLLCNYPRFTSKTSAKEERKACNSTLFEAATGKEIQKPSRLFFYQTIQSWLGKMLEFSGFETALDASLNRTPPPNQQMDDIWDGSLWKTFRKAGSVFTETSGNLVFGLWCDWFNPHGKEARKKTSVGVMLLTCYNLPPTIRYKRENMCLYGIMPGPSEPSTTEMNHFLKPLVEEMKEFWQGINFNSTAKHPVVGRTIRAAIWPIHGDVPAMKKVSAFTAHSSRHFCSLCKITDIIFHSRFPAPKCPHRSSSEVKIQAQTWEQATTAAHQKNLASSNGVRYTVLHELPYWKSVEFFTVDIMHNIFLGLFKDFSTNYLQVPAAGKSLEAEKEKMEFSSRLYNVQIPQPANTVTADTPAPGFSAPPAKPASQHSYGTRSAASNLHHQGSSSAGSDGTIKGKKKASRTPSPSPPPPLRIPGIVPEITSYELDLLQNCIKNGQAPSWLTKPQGTFGMASAGTPKAAEWHSLFKVYIVLAWVPHFRGGEAGSTSAKILASLLQLIQIGNICTSRSFQREDSKKIGALVDAYQTTLGDGWPHIKKKPNLHFAEHIGEISTRLGPPAYTASWSGERSIGSLVRTAKNGNIRQSLCASVDHPNDLELIPIFIGTSEGQGETLLHQHARRGFFRSMINNSHTAMEADPILRDYLQQNRQSRWSVQKLSASAFQALQRFEHLDSSHTSHSKFDVTTSIRIFNKAHSTHKKTPGNSYILYTIHSQRWAGCITEIVRLNNQAAPLLVVHSLKVLGDHEKHKNPYASLPDLLNASVVYDIHEEYHVIQVEDITGQLAVIKNPAGTFDINYPTLSMVGLANIVSDDTDLILFWRLRSFSSTPRDLCKTATMKTPWIWSKNKKCIMFVT
jgi:hypothetical protein